MLQLFTRGRRSTLHPCRMMPTGNTSAPPMLPRYITAAAILALIALPMPAIAAEAVNSATARQTFAVAQNWMRRAKAPAEALPIEVTGLAAVHVTIRESGPTVGQFTVAIDNPLASADANEAPTTDAMELVRRALDGAITEAAASLGRRALDLRKQPDRFQLDIQFATNIRQVRVNRLDELPKRIHVSEHGLAMSRAGNYAWAFPGNSIAANADLKSQLNRLLGKLALPLAELPRIGIRNGIDLYVFDTIHLAELPVTRTVVELSRGTIDRPTDPMPQKQINALADRIAERLISRQRRDGRFVGPYEPSADQFSLPIAREVDSALAAYVLARRAKLPTLGESHRKEAEKHASLAVAAITAAIPDNAAIRSETQVGEVLAPTSMALLAMLEAPAGAAVDPGVRLRLATVIRAMQQPDGWMNSRIGGEPRDASFEHTCIAAAALARQYQNSREDGLLVAVHALLTAIDKRIEKSDAVGYANAMPWLASAHIDLARLAKPAPTFEKFVAALPSVRKLQITPWGADFAKRAADTAGGYVFGLSLSEEPTASSATVMAGLAISIRTPDAVPVKDRESAVLAGALGARFIDRLVLNADEAYYVRNPAQAVGGVRAAPWDNRQPPTATAHALLALTELQHAIDYISGQVERE